MIGCLDEEGVVGLLHGALSAAAKEDVAGHLGGCASCRKLVAEMTLALSGPSQSDGDLAPLRAGATLGRYVILAPVGSGQSGLVYAAFDRELGRKVALKLLRSLADGGSSQLLSARLRREAQALAQLSHPNVVAVHDVDSFEERIFLAMEFVEGRTLGAWLREEARGAAEIVEIFLQAGEGLAAAHAAGLVHRDFKPENVLVGTDGRVRVTDFGLARSEEGAAADASALSPLLPLDSALTATGALVGTPAYMAPEQLAGGRADALSDQFSFCVALYEALHGERPFAGGGLDELRAAMREGRVRPKPRGKKVPGWIRKQLLRGLAAEREQRFPSLRLLLTVLRRGPLVTPARAIAVALLLAGAGAFASASLFVCNGADAAWGDLWNAAQQHDARAAFEQSGRTSADAAFEAVAQALGAYRTGWIAMHREACRATRMRHEQPESMLELRMRCLAERRERADALVHLLARADGPLVDRTPKLIDALPGLELCANTAALAGPVGLPPEPERRVRIADLEARHAALGVISEGQLASSGKSAAEAIAPLIADARTAGYPPLLARMLVTRARLELLLDHPDAALATIHEAAAVALEGRDDATLADAWLLGLYQAPREVFRPEEGVRFARYAEAAIARLGRDDVREALRLTAVAGMLVYVQGKYDEAQPLLVRARALFEGARGPGYWRLADIDNTLGSIAIEEGRGEDALVFLRRSEALYREKLGPDSSSLNTPLNNQASALALLGRPAEALVVLQRSLAIRQQIAPGGNNSWLHNRVAEALRAQGNFAAALEEDALTQADLVKFVKPDDFSWAWARESEGADLLGLGRAREAVPLLEQAVARWEKEEPDFFEPSWARFRLAQALWDSGGDRARAKELATKARAAFQSAADQRGSWFRRYVTDVDRWLAAHP